MTKSQEQVLEKMKKAQEVWEHLYFVSEPKIFINRKRVFEIRARVETNLIEIFSVDGLDTELVNYFEGQDIIVEYTHHLHTDESGKPNAHLYQQVFIEVVDIDFLHKKLKK